MGLFTGIRGRIRQAQAAVVIQKLLEAQHVEARLGLSPHLVANVLVSAVCDHSPGMVAELPHKFTLAIAALSLGISAPATDDDMCFIFRECLFEIEEHIRGRGMELGLRSIDGRLLGWSEAARAQRSRQPT